MENEITIKFGEAYPRVMVRNAFFLKRSDSWAPVAHYHHIPFKNTTKRRRRSRCVIAERHRRACAPFSCEDPLLEPKMAILGRKITDFRTCLEVFIGQNRRDIKRQADLSPRNPMYPSFDAP